MLNTLTEYKWLIGGVAIASALLFVVTLFALPLIIIRLPVDYFGDRERHRAPWQDYHPVFAALVYGLKNIAGFVFVIFGIIMLVTPGQGILSILIGLTMMNYPGKYRCERWLISRRHLWHAVGWIRRRAGVPPLEEITGT